LPRSMQDPICYQLPGCAPRRYGALPAEIIELCHQRWELETGSDVNRTRIPWNHCRLQMPDRIQ
jgi:hypothetical protein